MDIAQLREFDTMLPIRITRYLMGAAGLGKSSVVKEIAKDRGYYVVDLRLSELEPADLVGMPQVIKREDGRYETIYAAPTWWYDLENNDGKCILFLDELDRASENMQPLAMQLTLDRRAGGRTLPKNVIIYAAGNGEKYQTAHLDQALVNRLVMINFTPTPAEWAFWAGKTEISNVHPAVVQFLTDQRNFLDIPDSMIGEMNKPVTSRRSWSAFGESLWQNEACKADLAAIARENKIYIWGEGFVGGTAAMAFQNWVRDNYHPLDIQTLFEGKYKGKAKTFPITQVTQSLDDVYHRFTNDKSVTPEHRENSAEFYLEWGMEMFGQWFARATMVETNAVRNNKTIVAAIKQLSANKQKFKNAGKKDKEDPAST